MAKGTEAHRAAVSLLERLFLGGGVDDELLSRAEACGRLFRERPLARLMWMNWLRAAAEEAVVGGGLWAAVEPYLESAREQRVEGGR